jgi:hypothetical protein
MLSDQRRSYPIVGHTELQIYQKLLHSTHFC